MGVALHLRGAYSPPVGVANLHLGAGSDARTLRVNARSAGASLAARAYHAHLARVFARSPHPRVIARAAYDPNLLSDTVSAARSIWGDGDAQQGQMRFRVSSGPPLQGRAAPGWGQALAAHGHDRIAWQEADRASGAGVAAWQDADGLANGPRIDWAQGDFAAGAASTGWRDGEQQGAQTHPGWIQLFLLTAPLVDRWQEGEPQSAARVLPFGAGRPLDLGFVTLWQDADYPAHRLRVRPPTPPDPWEPIGTHLCLVHPLPGTALHLGLGCPEAAGTTIVVPLLRVYRVLNTVLLTRVSDGEEIPADGLSLSLDADSWAWIWSARIPGAAVSQILVNGEPLDLLATINGEPIRLLIDSISRTRDFGSSWLAVRGRGRAAVLASPTAANVNRYNTQARTAQQLLIDALTLNGVGIGWAVDWRLEDWAVPAGAWSHTGSYIEAATRIAEAGGGYVQGHDTAQTLIIRPYYPVAPWNWPEAAPDIDLPEDVCQTEGIEWTEKAGYNAVWITGGENGRRDYVRRAGTDGLTMAPTVVDGLATDAIMTRQRGVRILADTGRQALISVKLPVVEETGIIKPGNLIRYTEQGVTRLGLSRAVSLECGFPEVWQTIKLEGREA